MASALLACGSEVVVMGASSTSGSGGAPAPFSPTNTTTVTSVTTSSGQGGASESSCPVAGLAEPTALWVHELEGLDSDDKAAPTYRAAVVDDAGRATVVIKRPGATSVNLGGEDLTIPPGVDSLLISRYAGNGDHQWVVVVEGSSVAITGIAVDASGNLYLAGSFWESSKIGDVSLAGTGDRQLYLAKLALTGEVMWTTTFGAAGYDEDQLRDVRVYAEELLLVGALGSGTSIGAVPMGDASHNPFVARFDLSGEAVFAAPLPSGFFARSVTRGPAGDLTVAGTAGDPFDLGTGTVAAGTPTVLSVDSGGALSVLKTFPDASVTRMNLHERDGALEISGALKGTMVFGPDAVISTSLPSTFAGRLAGSGAPPWARILGPAEPLNGFSEGWGARGRVAAVPQAHEGHRIVRLVGEEDPSAWHLDVGTVHGGGLWPYVTAAAGDEPCVFMAGEITSSLPGSVTTGNVVAKIAIP